MTPLIDRRFHKWSAAGRRAVRALWVVLIALLAVPSGADAQVPLKGVALVIGQSKYQHLPELSNPNNDARAVEKLLSDLGFSTNLQDDRSARRLRRDLEDFVEDATGADVALIYYSGHGIEAGGENYLLATDVNLEGQALDEEDLFKVTTLLDELRQRSRIVIFLLDACRSSPFPHGTAIRIDHGTRLAPVGAGGLAASKGVSRANEPTGEADALGEITGFAAAPGDVALDGEPGTNSPYAAALAKHLAAGGFDFGQVMTLVAEEVYLATDGRQQPWVNAHLRRLLYFGETPEPVAGDTALIRDERRQLLLTIATTPHDLRLAVETLSASESVPLAGLYAMLRSLDVDVQKNPGNLGKSLQLGAERLQSLLAEREALKSNDVEMTRLATLADAAVAEGALNAAIAFHQRAKDRIASLEGTVQEAEADIRARRLEFADVFARSARTNEVAFHYTEAARDWAQAYRHAERWDGAKAFRYRVSWASALESQGDLKGDNAALDEAIAIYRDLLLETPRARAPEDWALVQSDLGNALQLLGKRKDSAETLHDAVAAYRFALEVRTRDRLPAAWARTQNNLAAALVQLGAWEEDLTRLEEALAAYRAALVVRTRESQPLAWAATQNNIGTVLWLLGQGESGTARLFAAVTAYRAALMERKRERVPLDWATTQNNLGLALQSLGEREEGTSRLTEAIVAYRAALEVRTEERAPLDWAATKTNLATALETLGTRTRDVTMLDEAEACMTAAWQAYRTAGLDHDEVFSKLLADIRRAKSALR